MWIAVIAAACVLLFLFLVAPSPRRHAAREQMRGRYIAHRGLHGLAPNTPENSLASFRAAVEHGYAIEIDIHLTADGEVVVFHDNTLNRMCGVDGRPETSTLAELKALRLGESEERIPTLRECLETVAGRVPLLIEFKVNRRIRTRRKAADFGAFHRLKSCEACGLPSILTKNERKSAVSKRGSDTSAHLKHGGVPSARLCAAANAILSDYDGIYWVQSFHPQVLLWYRRHRRDICRGQLAGAFRGEPLYKKLLGCLVVNVLSRPDFVSYNCYDVGHLCFRLCRALGAFPVGWTIRSQAELDACRTAVKTYIFEGFIPDEDG